MASEGRADLDGSTHEIDDLLQSLNSKDREALFLRFVEGRSHGEVAEVLGTSPAAAQKRSERALERLRSTLGTSLMGAGLLSALTVQVAEGAPLVQSITGASLAAAKTGKVALAVKPIAGAIWGAAAAVTLSSIPLSLAWKDSWRESVKIEQPVLVQEKAVTAVAGVGRAKAEKFNSAEEAAAAVIDLANRFGVAQAAKDRSVALIESLPAEWAHDLILQLDRTLPAELRDTNWHNEVRAAVALKWEPKRVPEDLITVWPMLAGCGMKPIFEACARVDLAATPPAIRSFSEGHAIRASQSAELTTLCSGWRCAPAGVERSAGGSGCDL